MDLEVEIKEEPVWLEREAHSSLENFQLVSEVKALKEETKSELIEPGRTQENAFETSSDVKEEIFTEQTVAQLVPYFPVEDNVQQNCTEASSSFSQNSGLKRHELYQSTVRPYLCEEYNATFTPGQKFEEYHFDLAGRVSCPCSKCNTKRNIACEMVIFSGSRERPYRCDECSKCFIRRDHLATHKLTHTGERFHICQECSGAFKRACDLTRHMLTHSGDKPFSCKECFSTFRQRSDLNRHMVIHSGERLYFCDECNKAFSKKGGLRIHMVTHSMERPFRCDVCRYACSLRETLRTHMIIHSGVTPYSCDKCETKFARRRTLIRHMETHSGYTRIPKESTNTDIRRGYIRDQKVRERRYHCGVCDRKFIHKTHLRNHMVIHSGERPYPCKECDSKFTQKSNLRTHMVSHSGDRPYSCLECGRTFARRGTLRTHMLIHVLRPH